MKRIFLWFLLGGFSLTLLSGLYLAPGPGSEFLHFFPGLGSSYLPWFPLGLLLSVVLFSLYFGIPRLTWHGIFFICLYLFCFQAWLDLPFLFDQWDQTSLENSWLILPLLIPMQTWLIDRFLRTKLFSRPGAMLSFIFVGEFLGIAILAEVFASGWARLFASINQISVTIWGWGIPVFAVAVLLVFTVGLRANRQREFYDHGRPFLWFSVVLGTVGFLPGFEWFGERNQPIHLAVIGTAQALLLLGWTFHTAWSKAYLDQLTQIKGRMALDEELERLSGTYTIVMIDIDEFKDFNDTYGHDAGDIVLRQVAEIIDRQSSGEVYRFGGEEFTILYPRREVNQLEEELEDIREAVSSNKVNVTKKSARATKKYKKTVSISLGAASPSKEQPTPEMVLSAADEAMYQSKQAGRNQLSLASS